MYTKIITYLVVYLPHTMLVTICQQDVKYLKDQSDRVVIICWQNVTVMKSLNLHSSNHFLFKRVLIVLLEKH